MTQRSLPYNGTTVGDAGPYSDADWQRLWQYIIGLGGVRANVGVFLGSGTQPYDGLRVQAQNPTTTAVDVLPGSALVQGIAYINDDTESFVIASNASGNPRIDTIVVQADYAQQETRLALSQGTPAASPVPPTLTQSAGIMWEIPVADIAVANGFTSISQSNITPRHEWVNAAPGVYLDNVLNNSGGTLVTGDVVIWDTSADRAVTTTTRLNHTRAAGVWVGRTDDGDYGRVLKTGVGFVNTNAAVTRGDRLVTSSTAKQAGISTTAETGRQVATALETTSGSGLALCNVTGFGGKSKATIADQKAQGTAGGSSTAGSWQTRPINTELSDPDSIVAISANQFTPIAGVFNLFASAPFAGAISAACRIRLRNVTAGTTLKVSANTTIGNGIPGTAVLFHTFAANGTDAYEIQYYTSSALATTGLGVAVNAAGESEIYALVELELVG